MHQARGASLPPPLRALWLQSLPGVVFGYGSHTPLFCTYLCACWHNDAASWRYGWLP